MATSVTQADPKAIPEIERLGFRWTEVAQYDLSRLSPDRRVQVRELGHYAPKDAVERYAVQMAHSEFPPVIVTADGWIVDGNTRIGAAQVRGNKFFPAYVLDVEYAGQRTTTKQKNELHALAATLNAQNGTPLTHKEIREVAARFIDLGWKAEQIARAIGVKPAGVTQVKKEITAAAKLKRVGMSDNGALKGASLRALGSKDVLALNDVPFRSLASLAADAGLNASEITSAAKATRETGSDAEQVAVLEQLRTEMGDRIRAKELTGSGKPPVSRRLRQYLGFVRKFTGREQELIETDPKVSDTHVAALEESVAVLTAVLAMQKPSTS
jgi:ParB-like chromosome segregation protein Spo0J